MAWLGLLVLMVCIAALPGISVYLESTRSNQASDLPEGDAS